MAVINTGVSANRFEADGVAKLHGGRLPKHAELDKFKMEGIYGAFWAREWAAKGVLIEKGRDIVDKQTSVLIPYSDIEKADRTLIESGKAGIVGANKIFFLIDPEAFTLKNGLYVFENPKITVVENAVLEMSGRGMADPETKIAIYTAETVPARELRLNCFSEGIWPLSRGGLEVLGFGVERIVSGFSPPSYCFGVLASTETAKVDATKS